jgi:hypothetical protein
MFFLPRRRPLLGAAMIGGGVLAGRHAAQTRYREADQEQRIEELEASQQTGPPAAPVAAPAAQGGEDLVGKLQELSKLVDSGALSKDEFEAAKHKLLAA